MDNVTHTLVGLMLSRAGLSRLTPRASAVLMLAANAPDCDIVTALGGTEMYFHHHRGITHALALLPVMALLPPLVVRTLGRKPLRWGGAFLASVLGVASHLLLDFTNHYGIRLFLPWSDGWPSLSITYVVDPWLWAVLLLAVIAPAIARLVSGEIGARPPSGRGWALAALGFILIYDSARWFIRERAIQQVGSHVYHGESPARIAVIPAPFDPLAWTACIETESAFVVTPVNLREEFSPEGGRTFYKPESSPEIEAAKQTGPFRDLFAFTNFALITTSPRDDEALLVRATDLRFGLPAQARFTANAVVRGGRVERAWFQF